MHVASPIHVWPLKLRLNRFLRVRCKSLSKHTQDGRMAFGSSHLCVPFFVPLFGHLVKKSQHAGALLGFLNDDGAFNRSCLQWHAIHADQPCDCSHGLHDLYWHISAQHLAQQVLHGIHLMLHNIRLNSRIVVVLQTCCMLNGTERTVSIGCFSGRVL